MSAPSVRRILTVVILLFVLAGCKDKSTPAPTVTPPPPTIPAVITQIVTPLPTVTPQPTPTLAYDMTTVAGRWIVRFDITVQDSAFASRLSYSGSLDLQVQLDGTASGFGSFSQNIDNPPCEARVLDDQALTFTATGTSYPVGDQVAVDLTIVPDMPDRAEHYVLICPDYQDVRYFDQPFLWPALTALPELSFKGGAITGLNWRLMLQPGQTATISADLTQVTGGTLSGQLSGSLWLQRG